jgi:hypothetical protein
VFNVARHIGEHGFDAQLFAGSADVPSAWSALARTIAPYFDSGGDAELSVLRTLADRMRAPLDGKAHGRGISRS